MDWAAPSSGRPPLGRPLPSTRLATDETVKKPGGISDARFNYHREGSRFLVKHIDPHTHTHVQVRVVPPRKRFRCVCVKAETAEVGPVFGIQMDKAYVAVLCPPASNHVPRLHGRVAHPHRARGDVPSAK